jgi:hypothetical protein
MKAPAKRGREYIKDNIGPFYSFFLGHLACRLGAVFPCVCSPPCSATEVAMMKTVWRLLIDEPETTLPWMLDHNRLAIGWGEIGDVRSFGSLDAIAAAIKVRNQHHPKHAGKPHANVQHGSTSLSDFCFRLKPGDLVIVSDKVRRRQVWEVVGDYEYVEASAAPLNYQHQRQARIVAMDPDALWRRAGGKLCPGEINYRTLGQCAKGVE